MEDTLVVRKSALGPPPRLRRMTTQFAPERRVGAWPWVAIVAILALAALGKPYDPSRGNRLSSQAGEVLRLLP